jgi:hypothetical protein
MSFLSRAQPVGAARSIVGVRLDLGQAFCGQGFCGQGFCG